MVDGWWLVVGGWWLMVVDIRLAGHTPAGLGCVHGCFHG